MSHHPDSKQSRHKHLFKQHLEMFVNISGTPNYDDDLTILDCVALDGKEEEMTAWIYKRLNLSPTLPPQEALFEASILARKWKKQGASKTFTLFVRDEHAERYLRLYNEQQQKDARAARRRSPPLSVTVLSAPPRAGQRGGTLTSDTEHRIVILDSSTPAGALNRVLATTSTDPTVTTAQAPTLATGVVSGVARAPAPTAPTVSSAASSVNGRQKRVREEDSDETEKAPVAESIGRSRGSSVGIDDDSPTIMSPFDALSPLPDESDAAERRASPPQQEQKKQKTTNSFTIIPPIIHSRASAPQPAQSGQSVPTVQLMNATVAPEKIPCAVCSGWLTRGQLQAHFTTNGHRDAVREQGLYCTRRCRYRHPIYEARGTPPTAAEVRETQRVVGAPQPFLQDRRDGRLYCKGCGNMGEMTDADRSPTKK